MDGNTWGSPAAKGTFPLSFDEKNPVLTAENVTDINALYVADPCSYAEPGGPLYLFMEVYDGNYGRIGLARSMDDGRTFIYDKIVLVDGYHHSYPRAFKANGRHFMIPESYLTDSIRLYEADDFPYGWRYVKTLVSGHSFVDPEITYHDGKWWLFASDLKDDLYLYYSDDLPANRY